MTVKKHELVVFLGLLSSREVEEFLKRDRCFVAIDSYILAIAFVFFKRANLTLEEYTVRNLWVALYLAHDAEEDEEPRKWEMLPWALGDDWQHQLRSWEEDKQAFWRRIKYRVLVTKEQCKQVMALAPNHQAWSRYRAADHGGAKRMKKDEQYIPSGPHKPTPQCRSCPAAEEWRDEEVQGGEVEQVKAKKFSKTFVINVEIFNNKTPSIDMNCFFCLFFIGHFDMIMYIILL